MSVWTVFIVGRMASPKLLGRMGPMLNKVCYAVFASIMILTPPRMIASENAQTYELQPAYSAVDFTVTKWLVVQEQGQFRDFTGTVLFDPVHVEHSYIQMVVQATSIDTKHAGRDSVLRSDDFFDVARYPTLTFESAAVRRVNPNTLEVTGRFTLHGTTRKITVRVKLVGTQIVPHVGMLAGFETQFTINRKDYGVLGARWSAGSIPGAISDDVQIHILAGGVHRE
jgi:polyisoprenoid-binding protein YceI